MVRGIDTTTREESCIEAPKERLKLQWVWPTPRLEELQGARLAIGREEGVAIRLAGSGVSRCHAELYRQGPIYAIRDLGSTNGTWLGGKSVEHAPVVPGNVLRVGENVGVFVVGDDLSTFPLFSELAPGLFGGPSMAKALASVRRAATSNLPLVVVGATGTGKELVARAVHHFSGRSGPLLTINCAAVPEQLAEGELFGYRRGAFTGAERANAGYFRAAHRGTLFLDEMPDLSPALQAKLLRVIEDGKVLGLGESSTTTVDVRIVSAAQRPLAELVAQKRLREDLAARLGGLEVQLSPLALRRADIAPLFCQFLQRLSGGRPPVVDARLIEALCLYDWPQNVRELELVTRTLLAVHGHEATLTRQCLPSRLSGLVEERPRRMAPASPRVRREHDLEQLRRELDKNGGNIKAAAQALGISRQRIYRLLDANEIQGLGPDRGEESNGASK